MRYGSITLDGSTLKPVLYQELAGCDGVMLQLQCTAPCEVQITWGSSGGGMLRARLSAARGLIAGLVARSVSVEALGPDGSKVSAALGGTWAPTRNHLAFDVTGAGPHDVAAPDCAVSVDADVSDEAQRPEATLSLLDVNGQVVAARALTDLPPGGLCLGSAAVARLSLAGAQRGRLLFHLCL